MNTAGKTERLKLEPDRERILANGRDLSFVTVAITDPNGWTVPRATEHVRFQIDGPGEIVATDNGDPTSFESFRSNERNAFNGLCLVIIRGKPGQPGRIRLTAGADGLKAGTATIQTGLDTH